MSAGDHASVGAFALRDLAVVIRHLRVASLDRRGPGRLLAGAPRRPTSRPAYARASGSSAQAAPATGRSPHPGPAPAIPARPAAPSRPEADTARSVAVAERATPPTGAARTRRRTRPSDRAGGVEGHTGEVWWAAAATPEALLLAVDAKLALLGSPAPAPRTPPGRPGPADPGPARVAVVEPDRERLERARTAVASGTAYADDDVAFTARGFVTTEGKVALLLPESPDTRADAWNALLRPLARWAGLDGPIGEVHPASVIDVVFHRLGFRVDVAAHQVADGLWSTTTDRAGSFASLARQLHADGVRVFLEAGTGRVWGALAEALGDRPHARVASLAPDRPPLAQADRVLARLWVEGCDVAPDALHRPLPHVRGSAATQRENDDAPAVHPDLRAVVGLSG